eukprot:10040226-Lingulodinium_polyedra.AAC.1
MAAVGISEWRIQVFGRWGPRAVLRYIREAQLAFSAGIAKEVADPTRSLDAATAAVCSLRQVSRRVREALPRRAASQAVPRARLQALVRSA